jgi:hypothetical protein
VRARRSAGADGRSLAELVLDLGLGEKAGEGGVRDGVVGRERPQRLAAGAAPK